jgi:hypothetical protein
MKFTIEKERENMINFLGITIEKEQDKLTFYVYREPTATDSIIPSDSCQPTEHKMAAVRYLTNRMNKYHLSTDNKDKERKIIKHILQVNKYDTSKIDIPQKQKTAKNWSKMGKIYIFWKRNQIHYETFQKLFSECVLHHTQYHWQITLTAIHPQTK